MRVERAQSQRDLGDRAAVAPLLAEIDALAVPAAQRSPAVPAILAELRAFAAGGD